MARMMLRESRASCPSFITALDVDDDDDGRAILLRRRIWEVYVQGAGESLVVCRPLKLPHPNLGDVDIQEQIHIDLTNCRIHI